MVDVSIVIVSFNTKKILKNCIDSLRKYTKKINFEMVIVDNNSSDGSVKMLMKMQNKGYLKLIRNKDNKGFSYANNQALSVVKGKYILLLNSDTELIDNVVNEIVKWMDIHSNVGIASCALKNKDGSFQGTGGYFPTLIRVFSWMIIQDLPYVDMFIKPFHPMKEKSFQKGTGFYKEEKEVDWITGAFFIMRKDVLLQIGKFDEDYFMYTEETDFCYRAKKEGWKVWYLPQWKVIHLGGASGTRENAIINEYKGIKLFYKKHYPEWQYPVLRLLLKLGSLWRIVIFGILEGGRSAKIYAKAFIVA